GQGLATRAVWLAAGWLIRERGAQTVELRVGRDRLACPRGAGEHGFFIDAAGCVDLGEGAEPEEPEWIAPQLLVAAGPLAAGVVTALSLPQGGPSGARAAGGRCPARCCSLASPARSVIGPG